MSSPSASQALDRVTSLAIAAGIDALRDAGIPLTMRYKSTTTGTQLPERWGLPDALRDDTGVIFASVFPGYDSFADEMARYYADHARRDQLAVLQDLRERMVGSERPARICFRRSTVASPNCRRPSPGSRSSLTGASCSASCPWGTRSSPS